MLKIPLQKFSYSKVSRRGLLITELIVAAGLLVAILSVVMPLAVRSGRLWQDSRHYRLATDELTNQLEVLTSFDESELSTAISNLNISAPLQDTLPNPELSAKVVADENGTRVVLRLTWDRIGNKSTPVILVGWVSPLSAISDGVKP